MEAVRIETQTGVYAGGVEAGCAQGPGVFEEPRGGCYEGTWLEGRAVGSGRISRPPQSPRSERAGAGWDGSLAAEGRWVAYAGRVEDGAAWGLGRVEFESGAVLEGAFDRGLPEGRCRLAWPDGDSAEGLFARGLPHGLFTCTHASEASIEKKLFDRGADCTPPAMRPRLFVPQNVATQMLEARPRRDLPSNLSLVHKLLAEIRLEAAGPRSPDGNPEHSPGPVPLKNSRTPGRKPAAVARKLTQLCEGKKLSSAVLTRSSARKKRPVTRSSRK